MLKLLCLMTQKERRMLVCSVGLIVMQVWLDLKMPEYMSTITTLVQTPGSEMADILWNGGYMLLCAVFSMAAAMVTHYFVSRIAAGFSMTLREKVFKQILSFESQELGRFPVASLITRTTNDVAHVQLLVSMGMQAIIKAPILLAWAILKISGKQWQWSLATGAAALIIVCTLALAIRIAMPKFKIMQRLLDDLNRITRESLSGIRVVRAYNAESYQEGKFEQANRAITDTSLFTNRVMSLIAPTMTFSTSAISLAIYWIGAYLIDAADKGARMEIFSDMVVFSSYAMQVIVAFTMLTMMFLIMPRVLVSVRRIAEVLNTTPSMQNGTQKEGKAGTPAIEFQDVCFRYPGAGEDVLHHISFTAYPGETVAIVGATASGKSSLVGLIPRLYDAGSGSVLIDGVDVRSYDRETLRRKIGFAAQKAVLFSGTVTSNVAYGCRESADVSGALETAQALEFVSKMYGKEKARIARGGSNVSGGQRQRLSIARALCQKRSIYIFDDTFSALDLKTDRLLRRSLTAHTTGATKVIVAQRIGTIMDADRILVLENGTLVGNGRHQQLMESCEVYRETAYSQLSEEELQ